VLRLARRSGSSTVRRPASPGLDLGRSADRSARRPARWIDAARDQLLRWSAEPAEVPHRELARPIAACLEQAHPDREQFVSLTARALRLAGVPSARAGAVSAEVFRNYLRTHFVDGLLAATRPQAVAERIDRMVDTSALDGTGGCVLASFHLAGYPLVPAALARRGALFLRPRRNPLLPAGSDAFVYATDPDAPAQMVRAVRTGRPVLMMTDPLDGLGRTTQVRLFGRDVAVHVGAAWLATRAEVPLVPIVLDEVDGRLAVRALAPVAVGIDLQTTLQSLSRALEIAVFDAPERWLHWYTWLGGDDAAGLRQRLRASHQMLWRALAPS
jgi:hypothetical protein